MLYITHFGDYEFPAEQYEMNETLGWSRRRAAVEAGGAGGGYDMFGTLPDPLSVSSISKAFILTAASNGALETAIDTFLSTLAASGTDYNQGARKLLAKLSDDSYRATWAKCTQAQVMIDYYNVNEPWVPVTATFERTCPVWWADADVLALGDHLGTFEDTAAEDLIQNAEVQAISSSPDAFTITTLGNARVWDGIIEFAGAITNPMLENLTNGWWFQYDGTLAAGDRLTVRPAGFDVRFNGSRTGWANLIVGTARGQLTPMVLEPGANSMRVTGTSPNCTFRYYWASAYAG